MESKKEKKEKCFLLGNQRSLVDPFITSLFKDGLDISTQTIIAISNFSINLEILFKYIPSTEFILLQKKRGRKKENEIKTSAKINVGIPSGSIISAIFGNEIKGARIKKIKKKKKASSRDYFLNSISTVIMLDNEKKINCKISPHGKFHLTGCKMDSHAHETVMILFRYMRRIEKLTGEEIIFVKPLDDIKWANFMDYPKILFLTVMINSGFNMGFEIQRENIDNFFRRENGYISSFEPMVTAGVNVKKSTKNPYFVNVPTIEIIEDFKDGKINEIVKIKRYFSTFKDYFDLLSKKDQDRTAKKIATKATTFMVFRSGKVIISGSGPEMISNFREFIDILIKRRSDFQEKKTIIKIPSWMNIS